MPAAAGEISSAERLAAGMKAEAADRRDPLRTVGYVLILIAVPLVGCNAFRAGPLLNYGDIPLGLGGAFLLASWALRGLPRGIVPAALPLAALLLLVAGLLAIVPAENLDSLLPTLRFAIALGLMPIIIMLAASTPRRIAAVVDVWLLGAAASSVVAALDLLHLTTIGPSLISVDWVAVTERAPGLTNHPNHLGLVAAMALPVAVARLGAGGLRGVAACVVVPLLIVGVLASGSRGALIAAAAGVVILFAFGAATRRLRTTLLVFAAPIATFVVLITVLGTSALTGSVTVERFGGGSGATESDNERLSTLRESLDQVVDHPIVGVGFEEVKTAHNIYVQLLESGGIIALVGFVAFAIAIVRRARWLALAANGSPRWLASLAASCGASVGVWLLFGLVGTSVYDRYLYVPVGITLALSLVHSRRFAAGEQSEPRPPDLQTSLQSNRNTPGNREPNRVLVP